MISDHEREILCNILLVILFPCTHEASFLLWAWLVVQLVTQTFSDASHSMSGTKYLACDCESWCDDHCLSNDINWTNRSSDPLPCEWKCQLLSWILLNSQKSSIFMNWTPRDFFFPHQGNFHYFSFFQLLNGKCEGELFKWHTPKNRIFPFIPCITFPPQYIIIRLIDLLPSSWANCCSVVSTDAQGSRETWANQNLRFWIRSTVIYGSLICV